MTLTTDRSGKVRFSTLLFLMTVGAGLYCAIAFGKVWWHRYTIQDVLDHELSYAGQLVDESIRQRVVARLNEMDVPAAARRVQVKRTSPISVEV
ncbi:MAG TPA: hypothetical protein VFH97_02810, partial [Gemmatimonadales bacterium]|nr:hypothetical protein [Gemmatimonadales bacterium]